MKLLTAIFSLLLCSVLCAEEMAPRRNLALYCTVSCSAGKDPEIVVDGSRTGKYWEAGAGVGNYVEVDLGEVRVIGEIKVFFWWDGRRYYQYYADASPDGRTWTMITDDRKNTIPSGKEGRSYRFSPIRARYVRLHVTANSFSKTGWAHVRELEIYAPEFASPGKSEKP